MFHQEASVETIKMKYFENINSNWNMRDKIPGQLMQK